jgi:hypothetical protein
MDYFSGGTLTEVRLLNLALEVLYYAQLSHSWLKVYM